MGPTLHTATTPQKILRQVLARTPYGRLDACDRRSARPSPVVSATPPHCTRCDAKQGRDRQSMGRNITASSTVIGTVCTVYLLPT
eukprot:4168238-Pleurochrysis_carterae.AAC.3